MFECDRDWDLIEVMGEATRYESMSTAQRLLAVAELYERRQGALGDLDWYVVDDCAAVAAEVSAVQNISHSRAVAQVQMACALAHRLPTVAKVFLRGTIDLRMVSTIIARTDNVEDAVMPELDEAIARHCEKWMKLSRNKLRDRVDQWVAKFDPAGVRIPPKVADSRYVDTEAASPGMAWLSGHLQATDAAAFTQRLDGLAATVCAHDPRTPRQRRADAVGALGRGQATLACECAREDCPAAAEVDTVSSAVIHLLADQHTVDGTSDAPGYLRGFGIVPAESVRQIAKTAHLKPLTVPTGVGPDPGYRPSAKTKEFVQWRDLTCRWPGCDKPVETSDIDHTVSWPVGPTHPSNNKHYCRIHHLIKTFFTGAGGWSDRQSSDGTMVFTAPSGHIYRTEPHGAALFPALGRSTGELDLPAPTVGPETDRLAMMPRRKQTRAQDRQHRINAERRERTELIAEEERQRQAWLAANYQPPPF
ncbi:HNH endonuclease signature motif containing protein [Mycolicibacterium tusciae]|uniref:HNH endonuclease signature motif containing protein n=1 Tax=Mycolicibacterium tusciae TaxID=75922 RepID=UPI00048A1B91|nr:HNH endonuclease signature motif containing protein [Mycolicibacterium tusciae]